MLFYTRYSMLILLLIAIAILIMILFLLVVLAVGIEFKIAYIANQNIAIVQLVCLKRFVAFRVRFKSFNEQIYMQLFNSPYRALDWLRERNDKDKKARKNKINIKGIKTPRIKLDNLYVNLTIIKNFDAYQSLKHWTAGVAALAAMRSVIKDKVEVANYRAALFTNNENFALAINGKIKSGIISLALYFMRILLRSKKGGRNENR